ncbi:hypothetical protein [Larkinella humicola]|uniref:Uncharacterized protein n=1 Tax=Larkinella humicola TaxID=2607654 RepID=A0A5N1J3U0_9BACT|nr:hypothetical protein [Larkinella humicola]KAA9341196.1 hypothetical protein F0P93_30645 [Larkinella humicola]
MKKNQTPATSQTEVVSSEAVTPTLNEQVDEETGEVTDTFKFKYLEGHPRQYRFDAKQGLFNINGTEVLGNTLTFQPLAWRIFTDSILNMGQKTWAELFFVDAANCVSSVLFHGYSVDNIFRLIEPLFYADLTLADVVITATAEKKENTKIQPKGTYYIATFGYQMADRKLTQELTAYAKSNRLFRQETTTDRANISRLYNWYNPFGENDDTDTGLLLAA